LTEMKRATDKTHCYQTAKLQQTRTGYSITHVDAGSQLIYIFNEK